MHEVVRGLDVLMCKILPVFHAFTGYDIVSAFGGKWKEKTCNV